MHGRAEANPPPPWAPPPPPTPRARCHAQPRQPQTKQRQRRRLRHGIRVNDHATFLLEAGVAHILLRVVIEAELAGGKGGIVDGRVPQRCFALLDHDAHHARGEVEFEQEVVQHVIFPAGITRMIRGQHAHVAEIYLVLPELFQRKIGQAITGSALELLDRHSFSRGGADIALAGLLPVEQIEVARVLITEHEAHVVVIRAGRHLPRPLYRVAGLVQIIQIEGGVGIDGLRDCGVPCFKHPVAGRLAARKGQGERRPARQVERGSLCADRGSG